MRNLALFNLDHTITQTDTFAEFLDFAVSAKALRRNPLFLGVQAAALKTGLIGRDEYEQRLMAHYFRGWEREAFDELAETFARTVLPGLVVPRAHERLKWHRRYGHEVCIVTSAIEACVAPWTRRLGFDLIANELETIDGKLTGRLNRKSNRGFEKVNRIHARCDLKVYERVFTYVHSETDVAMLRLGDEGYMNWTLVRGTKPLGVL